jgi:hypothetical protein
MSEVDTGFKQFLHGDDWSAWVSDNLSHGWFSGWGSFFLSGFGLNGLNLFHFVTHSVTSICLCLPHF